MNCFRCPGLLRWSAVSAELTLLSLLLLSLAGSRNSAPNPVMPEICDNAVDDDMDGLVDLNDPDCACAVQEPVSFIPNPSFEDLNCCPNGRSQLDCADSWIQASDPTTDLIHDCGWGGWEEYLPPRPFPDGEGIMGFRDGRIAFMGEERDSPNWKEYAGACLLSPLVAGSEYRFEFDLGFSDRLRSPSINVSFFGTSNCDNLPFGVGEVRLGCPTNGPGWVKLGDTFVTGGSGDQWVKAAIDVIPASDIVAIAIGPDCPQRPANINLYYFFDNLLLADFEAFGFNITGVNHPCASNYSLEISPRSGIEYQWYKGGVALVGETRNRLRRMYGEGDYEVVITADGTCRISSVFTHEVPVIEAPSRVVICRENVYRFGDRTLSTTGDYVHTFRSVDDCDSTVALQLTVLGELQDTVRARIFEGETYEIAGFDARKEGEFDINLQSGLGCDSLVVLQLDFYDVFIPTAFSPNEDGINDRFSVFGGDDLAEVVSLDVFDRWGNHLATGKEWDGRENGMPANPGVFAYVARLRMNDGVERTFRGAVVLMR